jgi:hypothetical protein
VEDGAMDAGDIRMAKTTLDHIVEEIKSLTVDEQWQLREILDAMLMPTEEEAKRQALHQALRAAGLITQVRQPRAIDLSPRQRIHVQGKPVSETIIKERR